MNSGRAPTSSLYYAREAEEGREGEARREGQPERRTANVPKEKD